MESKTHINFWFAAAGALMVLTVFIHIFLGGPEVLTPTRASALDPVTISVLSVIWHGVTWILTLIAAALLWASTRSATALVVFVTAIQIGFAALFIFYGVTDLGTLMPMPQWIIFLGIPALTLIGLIRIRSTT